MKPLESRGSRLVTEIDCSCSDFKPIKNFIQTDYPRVSRNPTRWSRGTKTLGTRLCQFVLFLSRTEVLISYPDPPRPYLGLIRPKIRKLNGTRKVPRKVFKILGMPFEVTLFDGISEITEIFLLHSQQMSVLAPHKARDHRDVKKIMAGDTQLVYQCSACGFFPQYFSLFQQ